MPGGPGAELTADAIVCCQFGRLARLRLLVEQKGVLSNAVDKDGCSLLHWAAINGHARITEYLLSQGADPNNSGGVLDEIPLQWAAREGKLQVMRLLVDAGSRLEHVNVQGRTVLHTAVLQQRRNVLLFLLAYGADPFVTDQDDMTPLSWCCRYRPGALKIVQVLARFSRSRINYQDRHLRNTALHWAVQCSTAQTSAAAPGAHGDTDPSLSGAMATRRQMVTRASLLSGAEAVKVLLGIGRLRRL
uniref:Uncharacterized protein n=1 Tax=Pinguiococcus pyrenoidosus TaxID=172671 RepID=A0A6U0W6Y3_9STRA|mmetsp:Transcript_8659/g.32622  ORF Transcript_8659/g.32622 Transcript_8659/m.32622 type:complete len:246 (+) Transcript_8659:194-931(+)